MSRSFVMLLNMLAWFFVQVFRLQNTSSIHYRAFGGLDRNCLLSSALGVAIMLASPSALADINSVTKSFTPASIIAGETSTITVTISNDPPGNPGSIAFTDNYPAGLTNAAVPAASTTCNGATATAAANGSSLSLSGGSINGNNICTVTVTVTACMAGTYVNPSFAVNSTQGGGIAAPTSLTVAAGPTSAATSTVVASPASVAANGTTSSTITVTLRDSCGNPVAGNTVTLTAGSGSSTISPASGPSNASGVVTFTVTNLTVQGPITYTATDTTAGVGITQTAAVTFTRMAAPTVIKAFGPAAIAINGISTLTVTLNNPNPAPITGLAFTDSYPVGLVNAAAPGMSNTCGGVATGIAGGNSLGLSGGTIPASGSCVVRISVTASAAGSYSNSTGVIGSSNAIDGTPSIAALTVNPPVSSFNVVEPGAHPVSGKIFTKITGPNLALDIVALDSSNAISTGFTGTVSVEVVDATSGTCDTFPVIATLSNQTFTSANAGRHPLTAGNVVTTAHANARVRIRYTGPPSITSCSGDNFSIRPQIFTISSTNATQTGSSGGPTIKTGAPFNLTAATSVAGYNGVPVINSNEIVGTPNRGAIGGAFGAASPLTGAATGANFFYSEVGNFGLNANAIYDSTFTSVDASGTECAVGFSNTLVGGLYGCSVGSAAVAQTTGVSGFGRFIPDNFGVSYNVPVFGAACGGFTYIGQIFNYTTQPVISVIARNGTSNGLTNATTTNYAGDYAKLTNMSLAPASQAARYSRFDALAPPVGATPLLDTSGLPAIAADPAIASFANGASTLTFSTDTGLPDSGLLFTRGAAVNAPFTADIALAIDVIDTDGVTFAGNPARFGTASAGNGIAFGGGSKAMRFGKLKLSNAYGSELLALPVPIGTEYWNGTSFVPNTLDNCTAISNATVSFGNYQGGITAANLTEAANLNLGGNFVSGKGALTLTKPTPAPTGKGSVDITVDLAAGNKTYLQSGPTYSSNPTARATFGIYKRGPMIYMRERY